MQCICIDEILIDAEERHTCASRKNDGLNIGHHNVKLLFSAPSIPEQPYQGQKCGGEEQRHSKLRKGFIMRRTCDKALIDDVTEARWDLRHDDDADARWQIVERGDGGRLIVEAFPDERHGSFLSTVSVSYLRPVRLEEVLSPYLKARRPDRIHIRRTGS